jgi:hypothetical protein
MLKRLVTSPRFLVYISCTLLALATSYCLGKDMEWDTMDYHLYAGFSAIHDRFGLDYFAAAPQSYLNPYVYAPFYLLVSSGLSALEVAGILAVVQSAILWLTYELALAVTPPDGARGRFAVGAGAALLAFANPVLMEQFGSSFADIATAELVLAGSLVLIGAIRTPSAWRMAGAGLLLGAASALKLTNSLDALSLAIVPLFLPVRWPKRWGCAALYGLSAGLSFALVSLPWSIQLERYFGNPLFPFLNGIFRSPQYTTAPVADFRFIPTSLVAALWRPFAMAAPVAMVHVERAAPDLRYAFLFVLGVLLLLARWASRMRDAPAVAGEPGRRAASLTLRALGCAFLINWVTWLTVSGNSRYFIPMACVAAVLALALACRLLTGRPKARIAVIAAMLVAQLYQVQAGAAFRPPFPWAEGGQWFDVSIPQPIASRPALYFSLGVQSNSFVVPYLPAGSGFINLEGDYVLGPEGANGAHIRELIKQFSPHLRVLVPDTRVDADRDSDVPHLPNVDDAVEPFGLRVDSSSCFRIVARNTPKLQSVTFAGILPRLPPSAWYTRYLVTCQLVPDRAQHDALALTERAANVVLDRLEDACPALFQPRRSTTYFMGSGAHDYFWVRWYSNTDVMAWVQRGRVGFEKLTGPRHAQNAGSELAWERSSLRVVCGRQSDGDFLRILPSRR